MSLQNLQADFIDCLTAEDAYIASPVQPDQHLSIYRNNVYASMVQALEHAYPLCLKILGEHFFKQAATQYVAQYPSRTSDLNEYGAYFARFIAEYEHASEFKYLEEVAKFEWACHDILRAPEHPAFDASLLEKIVPEDYGSLHFNFHPASAVLRFQYPILDIVDLCQNKRDENVDLEAGGANLVLSRQHNEVRIDTIEDGEYIFLYTLQSNMPLTDAVEEALAVDDTFDVEEILTMRINDHLLVDAKLL